MEAYQRVYLEKEQLQTAVVAFVALWDRSEEDDPPSLTEAAAAMRAAAGLPPEAEPTE